MIKALHGISTHYCNVMTEARIASETGFDGIEFLSHKVLRYLDNGGTTAALRKQVERYGLKAACLNALMHIERHEGKEKEEMLAEALRLTQIAAELDCPTIQILALTGIDHMQQPRIMDIMTENSSAIADIGLKYGVRYQIEVIAYTQFNSLNQALEVIERVGKPNVGLVIDFWHLYATGLSQPEDVAALDPSLIFGVHFCDGRRPAKGEAWEETVLRAYMPGQGEIDIQAWTDAVKATGYDGSWSAELFSPECWEKDHYVLAKEVIENMTSYTG
ncbi:sugar phosphate isomerase/epimerase family protein [Pantoea rwandensis]|uniref:Xylose isomerase n=1 Tax=Pantoea rwandensis TaxID=1076550 RepID=A0A1X1D376_9GAMM|nr:sugar phosphate isomerase/epimerase family protein [Pantoea rwandensis]ORM71084.1 xylose isomerase [Pantoea rwandensis]